MVSPKFEELFKQYSDYTDTEGRRIKIKMKEIEMRYINYYANFLEKTKKVF